jgi:hypothetical protein
MWLTVVERPLPLALSALLLLACDPKKEVASEKAPRQVASEKEALATPTASSAPAPKAEASSAPEPKPDPPSSPKPGSCAPLSWDKLGMNVDGVAAFEGHVGTGAESNARNVIEKFQTLVLDRPACGADGSPVPEVQLYTNDTTITLARFVGKRVAIEGSALAEHTAHHHRPIVVEVKKLTAK